MNRAAPNPPASGGPCERSEERAKRTRWWAVRGLCYNTDMRNTLFYGDNLEVLRQHVGDATVDLVYLDPPFNSNRDYNVLFKEQSGADSPAQIKAFGDTWRWANAAPDWARFTELCPSPRVQDLMDGFLRMLGHNDVSAYLVMMAPRLWHLHRVLKPTGSLYLHCDPTASHYLKILLDAIFGPRCFRNEVIWKRTSAHSSAKRWGDVHDALLFYTRTGDYTWNQVYQTYDESYLLNKYRNEDERGRHRLSDLTAAGVRTGDSGKPWRDCDPSALGRHWAVPREAVATLAEAETAATMTTQAKLDLLDENGYIYWAAKGRGGGVGFPQYKRYLSNGVPIQDNITDISPINSQAAERQGYPTQKPLALLERIITASSNPGDVVLDPFCGCGTAIVAAQRLGRHWLGIDVTPIATTLIIDRLAQMDCRDTRVAKAGDADYARAFDVTGLPTDEAGARDLFTRNPKDFEIWAVGLIPMTPQDKKGADGGIDGMRDYAVGDKRPLRAIAQVKGGHVGAPQVQQLRGAMERFGAQVGVFVSLDAPTRNMVQEAALAGFHPLPLTGRQMPRIQMRTVADLLGGRGFDLPQTLAPSQAVAVARQAARQAELGL